MSGSPNGIQSRCCVKGPGSRSTYNESYRVPIVIHTARMYGVSVEGLMRHHQTHIEKQDFLIGFLQAFNGASHEQNIRSGFEASGIVPFDPNGVIRTLDVK